MALEEQPSGSLCWVTFWYRQSFFLRRASPSEQHQPGKNNYPTLRNSIFPTLHLKLWRGDSSIGQGIQGWEDSGGVIDWLWDGAIISIFPGTWLMLSSHRRANKDTLLASNLWVLEAPPVGLLVPLPCWASDRFLGQVGTAFDNSLHQRTTWEAQVRDTKWPTSDNIDGLHTTSELHPIRHASCTPKGGFWQVSFPAANNSALWRSPCRVPHTRDQG